MWLGCYAMDEGNSELLLHSQTPRPIGFVSTVSKTGETNLAPFSCEC